MNCPGDIETKKAVNTWTLGSAISNQQVGNVWTGESPDVGIVSLSMGGELNVFDKRIGDKTSKIIYVRAIVTLPARGSICLSKQLLTWTERCYRYVGPAKVNNVGRTDAQDVLRRVLRRTRHGVQHRLGRGSHHPRVVQRTRRPSERHERFEQRR